jgi:hypothetical protein
MDTPSKPLFCLPSHEKSRCSCLCFYCHQCHVTSYDAVYRHITSYDGIPGTIPIHIQAVRIPDARPAIAAPPQSHALSVSECFKQQIIKRLDQASREASRLAAKQKRRLSNVSIVFAVQVPFGKQMIKFYLALISRDTTRLKKKHFKFLSFEQP